MTGLGDLFEEAMGTPPPSRLRAEEVYAAGRRRHRRRMAAGASALAVAVATAGVVGVSALTAAEPGGGEDGPLTAVGATSAASGGDTGRLDPRKIIQWSGAADRDHLYLSYFACPGGDCLKSKTTIQLVGSDDGGQTWTERGGAIDVLHLTVLGPDTLLATSRTDAPNQPGQAAGPSGAQAGTGNRDEPYTLHVSTDGGRTWSAVLRPPPVDQVPPGGAIICWSLRESNGSCSPYVFDPANRTFAPLAAQPLVLWGQIGDLLARLPEAASARTPLWLAGTDLVTGRPTTAVSTDHGRTWSLRELPGVPTCPSTGCEPPRLTSADGQTMYAVVHAKQQRKRLVYGNDGTAGWKRIPGADVVPYGVDELTGESYVTADGRHVICEVVSITVGTAREDDGSMGESARPTDGRRADAIHGCRFWSAPGGGGAYRPIELTGLPATVNRIQRTPSGWYYTHSYGEVGLYGSPDGRRWTALSTPER